MREGSVVLGAHMLPLTAPLVCRVHHVLVPLRSGGRGGGMGEGRGPMFSKR